MFILVLSLIGASLVGGAAAVTYTTYTNRLHSKSAGDKASKVLADAQIAAKEITLEA